ncbi:outer membrane beta-barrel protein [Pseudoflavitalea sp. G-6-1-2]|uniref:TonB-dependent receptor n=1 Tax=Pseudoflavitalea sp. G-6-1-2 TaxID=2728841 RepID=UPI00146B5E4C|nr:TonB-dependent receptor [Pseudoflavitalea sp. G-6-1-2]NML23851.1 outer membrane beta-barrel protein [Pseudoflavitalea sp. G-6-1-2]
MRALFFILLASIFPLLGLARQDVGFSISGRIRDLQNEPVAGATVRLLSAIDSSVVQSKSAKDNGQFEFTGMPAGQYIIAATATGRQPWFSSSLSIDAQQRRLVLPAIVLKPKKEANLKEVVVTAKKPMIEQDIDKTIVNVESMVGAASGNTLDVLERSPGVMVDANGEITLSGASGVLVLIDGRPTYLSGRDLAGYLRSLPGGLLDKIELITNPPAKYDANGGAIINIKLKKKRTQGYSGNLNLSYSFAKTNRTYDALSLNYLNRKLNFFGNFSVGRYADYTDEINNRSVNSKGNSSSTIFKNYATSGNNDYSWRTGVDYMTTSKTTMGLIFNGGGNTRKDISDYSNEIFSAGKLPDSTGTGHTDNRRAGTQLGVNANIQHRFNEQGKELTADINYIQYRNTGHQNMLSALYNNTGALKRADEFYYDLPNDIDIYTARADYSLPLKNKASFAVGGKSSYVKNDNPSGYFNVEDGVMIPDHGRSNHFIYKETIHAAYVNGRKDWKRFGLQLGLRMENTDIKGTQLGNAKVEASAFSRNYTSLFPSVFTSYKLDSAGNHSLVLSYGRKINRPGYQQLNPFLFFIDQYSYSMGNPYLDPSFSNRMELKYRYKQFLTVTLMGERNTDGFYNATRVEGNTVITRTENLSSRQVLVLMTTLNFNPVKWWSVNYMIAGGRFDMKGQVDEEKFRLESWSMQTKWQNQFRFGNWTAELFGTYTSPYVNWQKNIKARYWVNAGIQKKIMKGKGSLKLNVDDIFRTNRFDEELQGLKQIYNTRQAIQDTRRVGVAFTYSFGKETFSRKRKYNDNTADEVKERLQSQQ